MRHWRKTDADLLDPEADECLLALLARDAEPPSPRQPHRIWINPPLHHDLDYFQSPFAPQWIYEGPARGWVPYRFGDPDSRGFPLR